MQLTSDDLIAMIAEHLAGRLSIEQLATWAFDRFYEVEQGLLTVPVTEEEAVMAALDDLMFADDEPFALSRHELQQLMERLAQV